MSTITLQKVDTGAMKWGYAFAGACALGFAALIQVAFGGLDEEALANLPAIVTVPYGIAGKLGITVPLALLGVGLILRDVLVNRRGGIVKPDDLEEAEPLAEEVPSPALAPKPGKKIAALAGGFEGRHDKATPTTGGPVGDAVPIAQRPGSGQVVLSSAKYLNKNPSGCFRKGTSSHTNDE